MLHKHMIMIVLFVAYGIQSIAFSVEGPSLRVEIRSKPEILKPMQPLSVEVLLINSSDENIEGIHYPQSAVLAREVFSILIKRDGGKWVQLDLLGYEEQDSMFQEVYGAPGRTLKKNEKISCQLNLDYDADRKRPVFYEPGRYFIKARFSEGFAPKALADGEYLPESNTITVTVKEPTETETRSIGLLQSNDWALLAYYDTKYLAQEPEFLGITVGTLDYEQLDGVVDTLLEIYNLKPASCFSEQAGRSLLSIRPKLGQSVSTKSAEKDRMLRQKIDAANISLPSADKDLDRSKNRLATHDPRVATTEPTRQGDNAQGEPDLFAVPKPGNEVSISREDEKDVRSIIKQFSSYYSALDSSSCGKLLTDDVQAYCANTREEVLKEFNEEFEKARKQGIKLKLHTDIDSIVTLEPDIVIVRGTEIFFNNDKALTPKIPCAYRLRKQKDNWKIDMIQIDRSDVPEKNE